MRTQRRPTQHTSKNQPAPKKTDTAAGGEEKADPTQGHTQATAAPQKHQEPPSRGQGPSPGHKAKHQGHTDSQPSHRGQRTQPPSAKHPQRKPNTSVVGMQVLRKAMIAITLDVTCHEKDSKA